MDRRELITGAAAAAVGMTVWRPAWAQGRAVSIKGPVTGGKRANPLAAYPKDLGAFGYVEEEYFISGEARSYDLKGTQTRDGKWTLTPSGQTRPYTTRLLIQKPRDPSRFNGTVLVEWINVSPGNDNVLIPDDPIFDGFAYVGVSAQAVGVHGFPDAGAGFNNGLKSWDPDRYKPLTHPGDAFSFDIFHQVGRALKSHGGGAADPLRGLAVRKLIATGASQSAARLRSYINGVHPLEPVYDAFVPFLDFGNGSNYDNRASTIAVIPSAATQTRFPTRIREDLDVPVLVVNTEQEAANYRGPGEDINQPDTDRFRLWEVAGAPHSPAIPTIRGAIGARDGFRREVGDSRPGTETPTFPGAHVTSWHCTIAGFHHVHDWLNGGAPPPHSPRIRFIEGNKRLVRDTLGIGTGGIRLPEVDVPVEVNTGWADDPAQRNNRGLSAPLPPGKLAQLYSSHAEYAARVASSAQAAQDAGFIRSYRVQQYVEQAASAKIPPATGG